MKSFLLPSFALFMFPSNAVTADALPAQEPAYFDDHADASSAAMTEALQVGDRIRIGGSYYISSAWLPEGQSRHGTLVQFIPGQDEAPAAVIKLDAPITVEGVTGDTLVLELRNEGANWDRTGTVHVELCDFTPEPKRWQDRRQGKWVESHATYERVKL